MPENIDKGLVDLTNRILKVLLSNPTFKDNVRIILQNLDAGSSSEFVKTIFWGDMEFSFSVVAALPEIINIFIGILDESFEQIDKKIPDDLLQSYVVNLFQQIDMKAVERIKNSFSEIREKFSPEIIAEYNKQKSDNTLALSEEKEDLKNISQKDFSPENKKAILKEILATPFVKDILRNNLTDLKFKTGKQTVKTLFWEDMEFTFSLIAAIPAIVNIIINSLAEVGLEINEKIPPDLLREYLTNIFKEIDSGALKLGVKHYSEIAKKQLENQNVLNSIEKFINSSIIPGLSSGANYLMHGINGLEKNSPGAIEKGIDNFLSNIDKKEFKTFSNNALNLVFDRISIFKIILYFFKNKITRRVKKVKL